MSNLDESSESSEMFDRDESSDESSDDYVSENEYDPANPENKKCLSFSSLLSSSSRKEEEDKEEDKIMTIPQSRLENYQTFLLDKQSGLDLLCRFLICYPFLGNKTL